MKTPDQAASPRLRSSEIARKAAEEIDAALGQVDGRENLIQAMTAIIKAAIEEAYKRGKTDEYERLRALGELQP